MGASILDSCSWCASMAEVVTLMCICNGTGRYRIARYMGYSTGYQIVVVACACGAKVSSEKAGESV